MRKWFSMIKDQIGVSETLTGGKECRMEAERRGGEEETKGEGREEPGRGNHPALPLQGRVAMDKVA